MRTPFCIAIIAAVVSGGPTLAASPSRPDKDRAADPAAFALLKEAHDRRDVFPAGFPGFTADVVVNDNGKEVRGKLTYPAEGHLKLEMPDVTKEQQDWAREQLGSALGHRRQEDFARGEGANPLSLGPEDHSPLGRLVALNDRFKSTYRVRDGQITEVTRTMGPMRFTITVLDCKSGTGGRYLPSQFVVTYFDGASGAIKQVDEYSDQFQEVGGAWIPSARRIVTAENGGFTTRTFALSNVHLLGAVGQ